MLFWCLDLRFEWVDPQKVLNSLPICLLICIVCHFLPIHDNEELESLYDDYLNVSIIDKEESLGIIESLNPRNILDSVKTDYTQWIFCALLFCILWVLNYWELVPNIETIVKDYFMDYFSNNYVLPNNSVSVYTLAFPLWIGLVLNTIILYIFYARHGGDNQLLNLINGFLFSVIVIEIFAHFDEPFTSFLIDNADSFGWGLVLGIPFIFESLYVMPGEFFSEILMAAFSNFSIITLFVLWLFYTVLSSIYVKPLTAWLEEEFNL